MMKEKIAAYRPCNEQEQQDQQLILRFLEENKDGYLRSSLAAHMTASAWVINERADKVLMVYHRLYDSWAWTGGHADGEQDLLSVAMREVCEETGLRNIQPVSEDIFSLEVLTVDGHEKNGRYVPSHLHLNVTYLLQASEKEALHICEAENSGVAWFSPDDAFAASSEPWFVQRIYRKLNSKVNLLGIKKHSSV